MTTTIRKMCRLGILSLVALNLLLIAAPMVAADPVFTSIDVPGAIFTWSVQINAVGEIVGLYFDANDVGHGFLLSKKK